MAKMNDSQKIATALGTGLVLTLAAGGGIWWAMGLVEEKEVVIEGVSQEIAVAETKIRQVPKLESNVIVLRENVENYVEILPNRSEITDFLRTVQRFGERSGVVFSTIQPKGEVNRNQFRQHTYQIACQATTWQLMNFISYIESFDRFIKVNNFNVGTGDKGLINPRDVVHQVSLELVTYVYLGKSGSGNVQIPGYAGKREKLRDQIVQSSQQIKLETYEYKESGDRRDPFVDPRQNASGPSDDSTLSSEAQRAALEKVSKMVAEMVAVHERYKQPDLDFLEQFKLEKELQRQLAAVRSEVDLAATQGLFKGQSRFRAQWDTDVINPYRSISDSMDGVEVSDGFLTEAELTQLGKDMRGAMRRGDLEEARTRYLSVENRLTGLAADDARTPLAEAAAELFNRIEIVSEFQRIPLDITGVVVQGDGKSGLLVNGVSYEEGEYLNASLLLKAVHRESAEFVFQGYSIRKSW